MKTGKSDQCCGTCKWNFWNKIDGEFNCGNQNGAYYGSECEYEDLCDDWEGRKRA